MPITFIESHEPEPLRVVVAGGGIGGVEAVLALRALAGERVAITLLAPEEELVLRPLSVAEPFDLAEPRRVPLARLAAERHVTLRRGLLAAVDHERHAAVPAEGDELPYDALVLALGARPREAVAGALTFSGPESVRALRDLLRELERGEVRDLAFVAPSGATWTLPLYELALLIADHLTRAGVSGTSLALATPEERPLALFGRSASELVERLLGERGIAWHSEPAPRPGGAGVELSSGAPVGVDRTVALPRLEVPPLPGVPQGDGGFIPVDETGAIAGLDGVYAVGDATTHPIKQGGLATQQADAAAAAIARRAGADVEQAPFRPLLRGILLGAGIPHYLRADPAGEAAASERALWWPAGTAGKVAGRYLAPFLAGVGHDLAGERLADVSPEAGGGEEAGGEARAVEREADRSALDFALTAADADARWGDYESALKWLEAAQEIGIVLPPEYADRRGDWERRRRGR